MNGLDILNATPSGGVAGQAVAARAGDAAPDDPGGDAPRSFKALLDTFAEPAAATSDGSALPAVPGFVTPPSTVLRQALRLTSEVVPGNAAEAAEFPAQAADSASTDKKASATSDDLALTDLAGDPQAPAAASQPDAAPSLQGVAPWAAAVGGAVGLLMPAL